MIPRPFYDWQTNTTESNNLKDQVQSAVKELEEDTLEQLPSFRSLHKPGDGSFEEPAGGEHGVEVTDVYDVEAGLKDMTVPPRRKSLRRASRDSLKGDWGVEAVDLYEQEAQFVKKSWQLHSTNVLTVSSSSEEDEDDGGCDEESNVDDGNGNGSTTEEAEKAACSKYTTELNRSQPQEWLRSQSKSPFKHRSSAINRVKKQGESSNQTTRCTDYTPDIERVRTIDAGDGDSCIDDSNMIAEEGVEAVYLFG